MSMQEMLQSSFGLSDNDLSGVIVDGKLNLAYLHSKFTHKRRIPIVAFTKHAAIIIILAPPSS